MNFLELQGDPSDVAFFFEVMDLYKKNRRKIRKSIYIVDEHQVVLFCSDYQSRLKYENICKLVFIFSNILKSRLPDHIHARMMLGPSNKSVEDYVNYSLTLKPPIFGFININHNSFTSRRFSLWSNGEIRKMMLK
jgi:hypothetical protein